MNKQFIKYQQKKKSEEERRNVNQNNYGKDIFSRETARN